MANLTRNITREYRNASLEHVEAGMSWYDDANRLAQDISLATGMSVEQAAGIIAALSPMLSWDRNVIAAWDMARTGDCHAVLKQNKAKARAIRDGGEPLDVLGGDKVRSFFRNIASGGLDMHVTVDRHAIDVAYGTKHSDAGRPVMTKSRYRDVSDSYTRAARILSRESGTTITPAQIQAVTWCSWRARNAWKQA